MEVGVSHLIEVCSFIQNNHSFSIKGTECGTIKRHLKKIISPHLKQVCFYAGVTFLCLNLYMQFVFGLFC